MDSAKTRFWTTVSPHDAFASPLAHSEKRGVNPQIRRTRQKQMSIRGAPKRPAFREAVVQTRENGAPILKGIPTFLVCVCAYWPNRSTPPI